MICPQINEFVKLGGDQLVPYYADILGAILPCIADKEEKIRVVSQCGPISFLLFAIFRSYDFPLFSVWVVPRVHLCLMFFFFFFFPIAIRSLAKLMKNFVVWRLIQLKDLMLVQSCLLQGGIF